MHPNEYQNLAARTLIDGPDAEYTPQEIMLVWNALGVAGEAGEIADAIKKSVFHRHILDKDKLREEIGDCLWYVAAICTKLGFSLDEVMEQNIEKLKRRYPEGYSSEASKARVDVQHVVTIMGFCEDCHAAGPVFFEPTENAYLCLDRDACLQRTKYRGSDAQSQ